jgi:hypothetical protein
MSEGQLSARAKEIMFAIGDLSLVIDHIAAATPVLIRENYLASAESLMNSVPTITVAIRILANDFCELVKEAEKRAI